VTQRDLAAVVGVSQPTVSGWLKQKAKPTDENARAALAHLGLAWADVAFRPRAPRSDDGPADATAVGVVFIPRNGFAGAGPPYENAPEEPDHDAYPRFELLRLTGTNPEALRSFVVIGDSLAPEIPPMTRVLYLPVPQFLSPGLYVVTVNGAAQVRRVQQLADGTLLLLPINPDYQQEALVPVDDADTPNTYRTTDGRLAVVACVGKVVFYPKPA
jgi:phage repressor protein C with HTH and peptisase S24 domain